MEELCSAPDGPPTIAVLLRSGHSLGGAVEQYIASVTGSDQVYLISIITMILIFISVVIMAVILNIIIVLM